MANSYFGVDVEAQLKEWWRDHAAQRFGDQLVAVIVVEPGTDDAGDHNMYCLTHGDDVRRVEDDAHGRLKFAMRTGRPSAVLEYEFADMLCPGDFYGEGADVHEDYFGAAAGMMPGDNWPLALVVIKKLRELRRRVALAQIGRSTNAGSDASPEVRYMHASPAAARALRERTIPGED